MDFLQLLIDLIFFPFDGSIQPADPLMIVPVAVLIGISLPLIFWRITHAFTHLS